MDLTQRYLDELYLKEDISTVLSSLADRVGPSKLKSALNDLKKAKDPKAVRKILSFVPVWPLSKIEFACRKLLPEFDKCYSLAKRDLSRALPKLPKEVVALSACAIVVASKSDDPVRTTRKNVKKAIEKIQSHTKDLQMEQVGEVVLGFFWLVLSVIIALGPFVWIFGVSYVFLWLIVVVALTAIVLSLIPFGA